jgi:hypothetical protein
MRRTVSKTLVLTAAVSAVVIIAFLGLMSIRPVIHGVLSACRVAGSGGASRALAQSRDDTVSTKEKQSKADREAEGSKSREKGVNIRIDESGIRIETPSGKGDTTGGRIDIGTRFGESKRYSEKGTDIVRFGEDVTIDADELVRGDVVVFGGDVNVSGKVVGNVVAIMGNARIRSGAEINGDTVVIGGDLDEEPEAIIHGERVHLTRVNFSGVGFPFVLGHRLRFFQFFLIPVKFFISLILAFLIIIFLRDRVVRTHEHVTSGVLKSFGVGFLVAFIGVFVVVLLTIILLITLIGIPLAFILVVSCIAVLFVADTVFVYSLGSKLNEKLNIQTTNPFAIVFVGMAALYLPALIGFGLSLVPFGGFLGGMFRVFGWLLGVFAVLAGLGGLFLSRFGARGVPSPLPATGPLSTAGPVPPQ